MNQSVTSEIVTMRYKHTPQATSSLQIKFTPYTYLKLELSVFLFRNHKILKWKHQWNIKIDIKISGARKAMRLLQHISTRGCKHWEILQNDTWKLGLLLNYFRIIVIWMTWITRQDGTFQLNAMSCDITKTKTHFIAMKFYWSTQFVI